MVGTSTSCHDPRAAQCSFKQLRKPRDVLRRLARPLQWNDSGTLGSHGSECRTRAVRGARRQIGLRTLQVLNGSLPPRALRLICEWAALHADELADNWERAQALEPLVPIEPLA